MFAALIGVAGLMIGPWLSAVVDSVSDRSGGGRSFNTCRSCGRGHGWTRFVPLIGTRRCAACDMPMRQGALVVQLVSGAAFAAIAARIGPEIELVPVLGFVGALIALSAVDIERYRLPDRLLFPSFVLLALAIGLVSIIADATNHLIPSLVGALVYFTALLLPNLISPGGLAFGDVKLALLLGLFLGWTRSSVLEAVVLVIYALLLGMFLGTLTGLGVGVARRVWGPSVLPDPDVPEEDRNKRVQILKTQFPFGPALAVAAVTVMFLSSSILGSPGLL